MWVTTTALEPAISTQDVQAHKRGGHTSDPHKEGKGPSYYRGRRKSAGSTLVAPYAAAPSI